jgi:UPF0755 protein
MRVFAILLLLVALGVAAAGLGSWWERNNFVAAGPATQRTIVNIEPGSGLGRIATLLETNGVVRDARLFRFGVLRRGQSTALKAGEYGFPARASMARVLNMLVRGEVIQHPITIAEGLTVDMAMDIVRAHPQLVGEMPETPPEGSLLPETYLFQRGTTRTEIVARMQKAQADLLAAAWPKRKPNLPYTTQAEAINLASIVEKETALASERPRIAAVFANRMRLGMKLESDPTIIYGLTRGRPLGHPLRVSELARVNPYSTYQIVGLPPTPIANPGRDAILAVLNPPDSKELYFVADGTGGHVFAETFAQHSRNVAQWRRIERDAAE